MQKSKLTGKCSITITITTNNNNAVVIVMVVMVAVFHFFIHFYHYCNICSYAIIPFILQGKSCKYNSEIIALVKDTAHRLIKLFGGG